MAIHTSKNRILQELREGADDQDMWGSNINALFAVADGLTLYGHGVPHQWEYRPSPMLQGYEDKPMAFLAEEYSYMGETVASYLTLGMVTEVVYAGRVMNRYDNLLRLAGQDY